MPNTANGYPYPAATDTPDVPRDIKALADAVDAAHPPVLVRGGNDVFTTDANGKVNVPTGLVNLLGFQGTSGDAATWYGMVMLAQPTTPPGTVQVFLSNNGGTPVVSKTVRLRWTATGTGKV